MKLVHRKVNPQKIDSKESTKENISFVSYPVGEVRKFASFQVESWSGKAASKKKQVESSIIASPLFSVERVI